MQRLVHCLSVVIMALCLSSQADSAYPPRNNLDTMWKNHPSPLFVPERKAPLPWLLLFTNVEYTTQQLPELLSRFTATSKVLDNLFSASTGLSGTAEFFPLTPSQIPRRDLYRITSGPIIDAFAKGWHDFSPPTWDTSGKATPLGPCSHTPPECSTPTPSTRLASLVSMIDLPVLLLMGSSLIGIAAYAWRYGQQGI